MDLVAASRIGAPGLFAAACALLALAGCGEGTNSDPSPHPSVYRLVVANRPAPGQFTLDVIDPERPVPIALRIDFGTSSPSFALTKERRYDVVGKASTLLGEPWLVFVQSGRVFQVPLGTDIPAAPNAVSSMADACRLDRLFELDATGRDAWAVVESAGPDGLCAGPQSDNRLAFVRVGDSPSANATPIAPATSLASAVRDAEGRLLWMLALDGQPALKNLAMPAFKPDLQRVDVANVFNVNSLGLFAEQPLSERLFVVIGSATGVASSVRLLEGDPSGLSIGAPLRSLNWSQGTFPFAQAGAHLFAVDGEQVLRIPKVGASDSLAQLQAADGPVSSIVDQTDSHVLILQRNGGGEQTWSAVAKAGVNVRVVLRSSGTAQRQALLLSDGQLYYRDRSDATRGDIRRVDILSGADVLVAADTAGHGVVRTASASADLPRGEYGGSALVFCQPAAATGDCRGGRLQQLDPSTGTLVTLGSFADSTVAGLWSLSAVSATEGVRGAFVRINAVNTSFALRVTDTYSFEVGRAGSLQRVTTAIP